MLKYWFDASTNDQVDEAKLYSALCDLIILRQVIANSKQTWKFTQIKNNFGIKKFKTLIQNLHKNLTISITDLAKELGVNVKSLNAWLKMVGIKPNNAGQTLLAPLLFLNHNPPVFQDRIFLVNDKLAYLIGFLVGDGHVSHSDGRIAAYNTEFSLKDVIYSMLSEYGSVMCYEVERKGRKKLWRMDLGDCKLARLFTRRNISATLKDPKICKYFITGFYDAEGSSAQKVFGKDYTVSFTNTNKELLGLIRHALKAYYLINSSPIRLRSRRGREARIVDQVFIARNDVYAFSVSTSDFVRFSKLLIPISKHEQKRNSLINAKHELAMRR